MTFNEFINKYNGKYLDYDKAFGFQCTDVMRAYVKEVFGWNPYVAIPTTGNAKDIFNKFPDGGNSYFQKIKNTPTGIPKVGDIIFWTTYPLLYGWAGHVAVVESADMYTIISFDQNYPTGQPCHFVRHGSSKYLHGYRGCLGWLRKK